MSDITGREFQEAGDAVRRAVTSFAGDIDQLLEKWEDVPPVYVVEIALASLCDELSELTDEVKTDAGPATQKLLAAMAEYRDAKAKDR